MITFTYSAYYRRTKLDGVEFYPENEEVKDNTLVEIESYIITKMKKNKTLDKKLEYYVELTGEWVETKKNVKNEVFEFRILKPMEKELQKMYNKNLKTNHETVEDIELG